MSKKFRGYLLAAVAAALYGTNPAFAVPLYAAGMNPVSVLLFRYLLGIPLLIAIILWRGQSLLLKKDEIFPVAALGVIMGVSSLTLYESYNYINPGVASTLLFIYPVLVALIMIVLFHERFQPIIAFCLLIMGAGLLLLMRSPHGTVLNINGIILIMISSLTYAIYMVMIKAWKKTWHIPTIKSLAYQLLFGVFVYIFMIVFGERIAIPDRAMDCCNLLALAILPTVLSLLCTIKAIEYIGPTPTAIFGALEPVTAVILSIAILGETITIREISGGVLILLATMLVIAADYGNNLLRYVYDKLNLSKK